MSGLQLSLSQTQKLRLQRALEKLESLSSKANLNSSVIVADTIPVNYEDGILKGHGTSELDGEVVATVCGVVERVNKLVYVRTLRAWYKPETGDIIVGRVVEIIRISGDIGTATSFDPPYLPTKCKGDRQDQFPQGGYFVAASEGLWDNRAACGRRYRIRCISGPKKPCKDGSIVVEVVDFCRIKPCPATLLLSNKAFDAISRFDVKINVEYAQI